MSVSELNYTPCLLHLLLYFPCRPKVSKYMAKIKVKKSSRVFHFPYFNVFIDELEIESVFSKPYIVYVYKLKKIFCHYWLDLIAINTKH